MSTQVLIAGVGMVKFTKPGKSEMYDVMGAKAARAALADAGITYEDVQQAYAGFASGDTCSGQTALYGVGQTGIPVINVNNACASGSTALFLARQAVMSGQVEVALALGFEQMNPGALSADNSRTPITLRIDAAMEAICGINPQVPPGIQYFGNAGAEYLKTHGETAELFGKVSVKARSHALRNPYALFSEALTLEQVMQSPHIFGPITRLMCCPPTCGAAAVVVVSEAYARRKGLGNTVTLAGMALVTDQRDSFESGSMLDVVGASLHKPLLGQRRRALVLGVLKPLRVAPAPGQEEQLFCQPVHTGESRGQHQQQREVAFDHTKEESRCVRGKRRQDHRGDRTHGGLHQSST